MTRPVRQRSLEFQDETLLCRLLPAELNIGLNIVNLSENPIMIDWNEVRLIDPEGVSHPVLHNMVILPDISRRNLPSLVMPQGVLDETVAPLDHVFMDLTGWQQRPIFPKTDAALQLQGATFAVALPVKHRNEVTHYLFEFQVTEVMRTVIIR